MKVYDLQFKSNICSLDVIDVTFTPEIPMRRGNVVRYIRVSTSQTPFPLDGFFDGKSRHDVSVERDVSSDARGVRIRVTPVV